MNKQRFYVILLSYFALATAGSHFLSSAAFALGSSRPDISDFGDMKRRFAVYLSGRPWRFSEKDIDKVVGDPWTLNPTTAAKVNALAPAFRLRIYSLLLNRLPVWQFESTQPILGKRENFGSNVSQIVLDEKGSAEVAGYVGEVLNSYFSTEEYLDLGAFLVSRLTGFPRNDNDWQKMKKGFVVADVWIVLAGLLALMAEDQGRLTLSGWVISSDNDSYRLGWYASVKDFGFENHPLYRAGMKIDAKVFELAGGISKRIRAGENEEKESLEFIFKERLLGLLSKATGWDLSAEVYSSYVTDHRVESQEGKMWSKAVLFGRKPKFLGNPALDLLVDASYTTNFDKTRIGEAAIGVEDSNRSLTAVIRGALQSEDGGAFEKPNWLYSLADVGEQGYQLGVLVGGNTDPRPITKLQELTRAAARLRDSLNYFETVRREYQEVSQKLEKFGTGELSAESEQVSVSAFRLVSKWMASGAVDLKSQLDVYLEKRKKYYGERDNDFVGPVDTETLEQVRESVAKVF